MPFRDVLGGTLVQARRAKASPLRIVIPIAVIAALLAGGAFAVFKLGGDPTTANTPTRAPSVAATQSTAQPTSTESPSSEPSATSTKAPTVATGAKALKACQRRVRVADDVLAAAKTGVRHWAIHVQAQTDANARKISIAKMGALFKKTRLAGPADQQRYRDALSKYEDLNGSCDKVKGATASVAEKLSNCRDRAKAQKPVLAAAADGMADWKSHLAAMQRNAKTHVPHAESVWLRAWRAAPPHIKAYKKAAADFDAPKC